MMGPLGRRIRYLRVSWTDRCNRRYTHYVRFIGG